MIKRDCLLLGVLLLTAAPAAADPVTDLTRLVDTANQSRNPGLIFFRGLADLEDFDLGPSETQRVLGQARFPQDRLLGVLFTDAVGFKKTRKRIVIERKSEAEVTVLEGHVQIKKTVRFVLERLRRGNVVKDGEVARLSSMHGVKYRGKRRAWRLIWVAYDPKGSGTEFTYCYGLPMYFTWDTTQLPATGARSGAAGALSSTP